MNVVATVPKMGVVSIIAIFLLVLVFIGNLAGLHPIFEFRGLGALAIALGLFALFTAKSKQSLAEVFRYCPIFKYVLILMCLVYLTVPFSVYIGGAFNGAKAYLYNVAFFLLLLVLGKGRDGLRVLIGSGVLVFATLTIGLLMNYGTGRISISAGTYDPNDTAYILVSYLPLVFYSLQTTKIKALKIIGYVLTLLSLVSISLTQSRGGSLTVVLIFLLFLRLEKVSWKVIMVGGMVCLMAVFFMPEGFWGRMSTLTSLESDYNMTSDSGRIAIWKNGLELLASHPLTGVGYSQFTTASGMSGAKFMTAHNAVIQVGVELGLVGLFCYLYMVISPIHWLKKRIKDRRPLGWEHYPLYKGLYIAFAAQFVSSMFLSVGYFHSLAYLVVVYICLMLLDIRSEAYEASLSTGDAEQASAENRADDFFVSGKASKLRYKKGRSYTMRK